jgi:hypothetical protein
MDTLLTLLGSLVLVFCLAYFYDQDAPNTDDRLFQSADRGLPLDMDSEEPVGVSAVVERASGPLEG